MTNLAKVGAAFILVSSTGSYGFNTWNINTRQTAPQHVDIYPYKSAFMASTLEEGLQTETRNGTGIVPAPSSEQSMPRMVGAESAKYVKSKKKEVSRRKLEEEEEAALRNKRRGENAFSRRNNSFQDQLANSGVASAAAMATAAVNAAVSMKTLEAPDVSKSYIAAETSKEQDADGLPLTYDRELISKYWQKERGALNKRWGYFVSKAVPFLTKLTTLFITEGKIDDRHIPDLSRQARQDLQDLGPTFIKAGQMMSVRPDVLPQATLDELTRLQDDVVPFDTSIAVQQIESELGGPLGQFFTSISEEPVAAASLAQVYLATLADGKDTKVAVKVQRPDVLATVSKDLYVLRRAAEVFQGLVERFAPQQRTNYVALLNEWAIGFYTELDFQNEAQNQKTLRQSLIDNNVKGVTVPRVYEELCTRRILVSEWMDGQKLSQCTTEEIARVTPLAQEAFLVQLFTEGFFHADPHPGNILKLHKPTAEGHEIALIDCGLMARVGQEDRDKMISAVIHLANKDYASLVDDFMALNILPADSDRATIIPLMDKALSPYVKGGGAKQYEEELKRIYGMKDSDMSSQVGGFQAMTQDALTVLNDVPFSIPPYFAILGRAIVTLEGIALTGDPGYGLIMEAYPFIARQLLKDDRPEIQTALQEVLYSRKGADAASGALKLNRLLVLLNNAAGSVGKQDGGAFVDLDTVPEDGVTLEAGLKFVLSDNAESLRRLLDPEIENVADILSRQIIRKGVNEAIVSLAPPRPPALPFLGNVLPTIPNPKLDEIPLPILLPAKSGNINDPPSVGVLTLKEFIDFVAPKLDRNEEIYAIGLGDAAEQFFGNDVANFVRGESVLSSKTALMVLRAAQQQSGRRGSSSNALLSSNGAQTVLQGISNLLEGQGGTAVKSDLASFFEAADRLDSNERERFDDIVAEIINRCILKAIERLKEVPRLF